MQEFKRSHIGTWTFRKLRRLSTYGFVCLSVCLICVCLFLCLSDSVSVCFLCASVSLVLCVYVSLSVRTVYTNYEWTKIRDLRDQFLLLLSIKTSQGFQDGPILKTSYKWYTCSGLDYEEVMCPIWHHYIWAAVRNIKNGSCSLFLLIFNFHQASPKKASLCSFLVFRYCWSKVTCFLKSFHSSRNTSKLFLSP